MSNLTQEEIKRIKEYLGRKLSEGKLILFTGAGFSANAKNKESKKLPSSNQLAKELSELIDLEYSENASLKDVFALAILRKKKEVSNYLKKRLTVDSQSLNDEYKTLINQPWYKIYTVNIDNLFNVAQVKFNPERRICCISSNTRTANIEAPKDLTVTHLHGMIEDIPDKITFSQEQYSEKITVPDAYYSILSSDILQYPFVFLGSQLDEDIFWHYIYLRKRKGAIRKFREFRPNSFIVIPKISQVRKELLKEYNITWIPHTSSEFSENFLLPLETETQKGFMKIKQPTDESIIKTIPLVSNLITLDKNKASHTHYLLGAEPSWKDIYSNLSIERDKEKEWIKKMNDCMKKNSEEITPVFIFTGTAGDGKTSVAMRAALQLANEGRTVGWIDRDSNISPYKITSLVENTENLEMLFIDTPDSYGQEIPQIISNLALRKKLKFIALVMRSSKVDHLIKSPLFDNSIQPKEFSTYKLTDNEINKVLDLLEEQNLIGALKQKKRSEQVNIFKEKLDRQLIVAMIEATSGKDFIEKICEEFEELNGIDQQIYCLVAIATSRNYYLLKDEVLLGIGESDNTVINIIDTLVRRGLLIEENNRLKVRHRVIAQQVSERLSSDNQLMLYYTRLAYIAAVKSISPNPEQKRMKRLLKKIINHEFLFKISVDISGAQSLYEAIEDLLKDDHHFWLQRGCFELGRNLLHTAKNYLDQSFSLNSDDSLVVLSIEHLNFKKAIAHPNTEKSFIMAKNAYDNIIQLINQRGKSDPYPYHVLGTQGLLWAKQGIKDNEKRKKYLEDLLIILKEGTETHKLSKELKDIRDKIQSEVLHFFVRN